MADLSKIKLNGIEYNIKDTVARTRVAPPLATPQNDGLMSATDKQLLDNLNPNVETTLSNINQTTYQIINAKQENLLGMTITAEPIVSQQLRTSNLLDVSSYTPGYYIGSNGNLANNANDHVGDFIPVTPGDTIYYTGIIGPTNSSSINRRLHVYNANQTWIKQLNFAGSLKVGDHWSTSGVVPDNGAYVRVSWGVEDYNVMITVGAPTKYEPYYITPFSPITSVSFKIGSTSNSEEATTYTYNVPAAAGDQYDFTFDPVSGKLYQITGHIASYNGETLPGHWQSDRDIYVEGTTPQTGAEVIYRLADEDIVEYDGTPMTIPLNFRTNYFFTYGGFLQELKYYAETFAVQHLTIYNGITYGETNVTESNLIAWNNAADAMDTKANLESPIFTGDPQGPNPNATNNTNRLATTSFVQERLSNIANFQANNKANKNYDVGQYLYMNGWMYKVTAAIAKNATITVGTNVERTDVATELELLFSLINNA